MVFLDNSLGSRILHHSLFSLQAVNVHIVTKRVDDAVELITSLAETPGVSKTVYGTSVSYLSAFKSSTFVYYSLDNEVGSDGSLEELQDLKCSWQILVVSQFGGVDWTQFEGTFLNAVVLMSGGEKRSKQLQALSDECVGNVTCMTKDVWRQIPVNYQDCTEYSPFMFHELGNEYARYLLTNDMLEKLDNHKILGECTFRNAKLVDLLTLGQIEHSETQEDLAKAQAVARRFPDQFPELMESLSKWYSMTKHFSEETPESSFWSVVSRISSANDEVSVPVGFTPAKYAMEMLILLVHLPQLGKGEKMVQILRDRTPLPDKLLLELGEDYWEPEEDLCQGIKKSAYRPLSKPDGLGPTERKPASFRTFTRSRV